MRRKQTADLPEVFQIIAKRYATDFNLARKIYFETCCNIDLQNFPLSLIPGSIKKWKESIFEIILQDTIENDKVLKHLLKNAKIENISYKNRFLDPR